jgi:hypothetical protein
VGLIRPRRGVSRNPSRPHRVGRVILSRILSRDRRAAN